MKKQYQGAVFLDFDGTLVDEQKKIYTPTETTCQALKQLQERGYLVGLATGRSKCYVPQTPIDFDCYITTNGAYAQVDGQAVCNHFIEEEELTRLFSYFDQEDIAYVAESQDHCYVSNMESRRYLSLMELFHIDTTHYHPLSSRQGEPINKLMVMYHERNEVDKLKARFGDRYEITSHRDVNSSDMGKRGINKGVGIQAVIQALGLELENTYAFGDGENDYDMLRQAGHGIAMGRHVTMLEDVAEFITATVSEEGIFQGLRHFGLV